ncbi:MAG: tRNA 2-thiouridine(34) synthase MnmA [Clostridiales bacterium]|nr:tRNA 2-thiouridine(34) synthase MnmA [Clostridiales bacterium]
MQKKVMVAMSGGVDSSVAAALLLEQGYEVCGVTLKLFSNSDIGIEERTRTCCSLEDVQDARSVAYKLGFEHYVFNFGIHFQNSVMSRFVDEYLHGRTPNPCIDCNRYVKFSKLIDRALLMEQDYIATGHYARIEFNGATGRYELKKARDITKDQTYVLYALTQHELAHTLFPLGDMLKKEVREYADEHGLVTARKPDSQDICFVVDGDYAGFIEKTTGQDSKPGNFVDAKGNILGTHKGIIHYTIGQRRGIGLSFDGPRYVVDKDYESNTVVIGTEEELYKNGLVAADINWISIPSLSEPMTVNVKTRYSQKEAPATIFPGDSGTVSVRFDEPQRAITPGQAVVFYDGETVVGGGTILKSVNFDPGL